MCHVFELTFADTVGEEAKKPELQDVDDKV
jgi:hypothetical protein